MYSTCPAGHVPYTNRCHTLKMKRLRTNFTISILTVFLMTTSCGLLKKSQTDNPVSTKTESSKFPEPVGYINAFENILTDQEERELTAIIKEHESKSGDQISIVTLTSLEPYDNIDDYSLDLANYWGVGQKEKDNGILIALGKGLRKIRIQNGYGIEKRLTDIETKKIIDEVMIPDFKNDNYFEGLKKGVEAIIEELK